MCNSKTRETLPSCLLPPPPPLPVRSISSSSNCSCTARRALLTSTAAVSLGARVPLDLRGTATRCNAALTSARGVQPSARLRRACAPVSRSRQACAFINIIIYQCAPHWLATHCAVTVYAATTTTTGNATRRRRRQREHNIRRHGHGT